MRKTFLPPLYYFALAWQAHKHLSCACGTRLARWALATVALIGLASTVRADTFNLTSMTYIDSFNTTSNYGGKTTAKAVLNGLSHGTAAVGQDVTRILMGMPSVTVPAGEEIQSVSLDLYCTTYTLPSGGTPGVPTTFSAVVYPLTQSFVQGTGNGVGTSGATWLTYDGTHNWASTSSTTTGGGGDYDPTMPVQASATPVLNQWTTFDLTSIWSDPSVQANGLLLTVSPENSSLVLPANSFVTEGFASDGYQPPPTPPPVPYLAVTFTAVPEPSTVALLLAGTSLAAIGLARRWKTRKGVVGTT